LPAPVLAATSPSLASHSTLSHLAVVSVRADCTVLKQFVMHADERCRTFFYKMLIAAYDV
jgi:hypothetical protein